MAAGELRHSPALFLQVLRKSQVAFGLSLAFTGRAFFMPQMHTEAVELRRSYDLRQKVSEQGYQLQISIGRMYNREKRQGLRTDLTSGKICHKSTSDKVAKMRSNHLETFQDKRKAVLTLLEDEEWSKWSDNQIAEKCEVSQPFVSKIRWFEFGYFIMMRIR